MKETEFKKRMDSLVAYARELFKDQEEQHEETGEKFSLLIQGLADDKETGGAHDRFMAIGNILGLESVLVGVIAHNLTEMHQDTCQTCSQHEFTAEEFHKAQGQMLIGALEMVPGYFVADENEEEVRHVH